MAETPAPIFILAAPFSGASWLAGVLGQHPQLYALPQIFPLMADSVGELLEVFGLSQLGHGDGLRRAIAELECGGQNDAQIAAADHWLDARRDWPVAQLLAALAAAAAPRRLVIPDAEAPLRPQELRRLAAAVPDARWLHLTRHPWTQGCRFGAWLAERLFVPVDFRDHAVQPPVPEPQLPWLRANRNLDLARAALLPGQGRRLASEDFEQDFDAAIAALCDGLALPHDAWLRAAMARPEDWRFAAPGPASAPGGLEAEVWAEFAPSVEALAESPQLQGSLPWRHDGTLFAPEILALADSYGYR